MKIQYDLHLHSCLSPCGSDDMTPCNMVNMAALLGFDMIAITDHNSCLNAQAAIAAGKQGAISIHRFVQPHSSLTIGRDPHYFVELNKDDINIESYDNSSRQVPMKDENISKNNPFRDAKLPFTEEQVKKETARCLGCGATIVDENKCIGCGICTTKCEFEAIHLERDLPGASVMRKSEDKLKYILPNGAKQAIKIKFSKKK